MSYPVPGLTVTVPVFYYRSAGTITERVDAGGIMSLDVVTSFDWDDVRSSWALRVEYETPPAPPGGPWFGPNVVAIAQRYRTDTDTWVTSTAASGGASLWENVNAQGPTGMFRVQYPDTQFLDGGSFAYTFNDPSLTFYLWPEGVLPPGVDVANPVRFVAKPMASAKGALQTVIDGGGP